MELEQSKLYDILIACLKRDKSDPDTAALSALSAQDWHNLLALSTMQRVTHLLWHRLKQKGLDKVVPDAAAATLHASFLRNTMKNMRLNGEMCLLLSRLNTENIPLILLKGIVLANTVYENIGLREMNDIDLLVRPGDLQRITDILTGMGYHPMQAISINLIIQTAHHLPGFIKKGHAKIEFHWNITHPNKNYSIDPHGLWERAVPIQIAGCNALMLSPEDLFLHLCLHTSYLHPFTFGLRPFCDIAETIDHFGSVLDWQNIAERTISQKWQRGVYLALRLAVDLAGASVPDDTIEKLQPTDMPGTILETARTQIFTDKYFAASIPTQLAQLLGSRRLSDKFKIFWQRVFLPKAVIAKSYSVPMDSLRIYLCYLRRFYDVLRRHGRTFKKFQKNDYAIKSLADRKKIIADWMD
jgi:hypothetical protein